MFYESVDFAVFEVDRISGIVKGKGRVRRRCWDWCESCHGSDERLELRVLHPTPWFQHWDSDLKNDTTMSF